MLKYTLFHSDRRTLKPTDHMVAAAIAGLLENCLGSCIGRAQV